MSESAMVLQSSAHTTKTGKPYWRLQLRLDDEARTEIGAIAWTECILALSPADRVSPPAPRTVLSKLRAEPSEFNGEPQLTLKQFVPLSAASSATEASRFRTPPCVDVDVALDVIWTREWPDDIGVTLRDLRAHLESSGEFARYCDTPGGAENHHAHRAGLLQHTMEMLEIADGLLCSRWIQDLIDWPILQAAIVLHDLGKLHEYDPETLSWGPTISGQLLGHPSWAVLMVERFWPRGADDVRKLRLQHAVLCHHGRNFSPVTPCTAEAILLHAIDGISANMSVFRDAPGQRSRMLGAPAMVFPEERRDVQPRGDLL